MKGELKMANLITYVKASLPWTAKQLVKMMENGTATFDNAVQRGLVWNKERKSEFIHSLIVNHPVPPMYANHHTDSKTYDFLDGKQRANALKEFMDPKNGFTLVGCSPLKFDDGTEVDINGMKFTDLDEDCQDNIRTYGFNIYYFDDMTPEQEAEMFFKLNSGKPMSSTQIIKCRTKGLEKITETTEHSIFDKMKKNDADFNVALKSFAILNMEEPCLDNGPLLRFAESFVPTKEKVKEMEKIFTKIQTASNASEDRKAGKKMLSRTNLITLVPFALNHLNEDIRYFLELFFTNEKTSINESYNEHALAGSGHAHSIKAREEALEEEYKKFKEVG